MDQRVPDTSEGWKTSGGDPSLSDVHRSVAVHGKQSSWRRAAAFFGPGYLVAVGYMDPGNWATSLAGGSRFGYTLLVVALVSNIMALDKDGQPLTPLITYADARDMEVTLAIDLREGGYGVWQA